MKIELSALPEAPAEAARALLDALEGDSEEEGLANLRALIDEVRQANKTAWMQTVNMALLQEEVCATRWITLVKRWQEWRQGQKKG